MTARLTPRQMMHAGLAAGIALAAIFAVASVGATLVSQFMRQLTELESGAETAAAFALRLDEARHETRERLAAVGADPQDLSLVSSPQAAKALVAEACAAIAKAASGLCIAEETPITATLSLYQARLTLTGPLPALMASIEQKVISPLRIGTLAIRPGAGPGAVEISALLEVAGARDAGDAP